MTRGANDYLALDDSALLAQCTEQRFRGGGPGGQKRNKTENGVRLQHGATGLSAEATEERSLVLNRQRALSRLRQRLALKVRKAVVLAHYLPSLHAQRLVNDAITKRERAIYWHAIQELLDLFEAVDCVVAQTAERLNCSTGRLSRILTEDKAVLGMVNMMRQEKELRPLRR